ncbi:Transport and Golgi organization protein 6-like protein [Hanseniaspora uvarum DSM 2768]|nr:Transport and Golgi organization protein 6-like protein [Hanseniaspora uvarum DSM 2768]
MNSMIETNDFKDAIASNPQDILVLIIDLLNLPNYFHSLEISEDDSDSDDEDENTGSNQNVFNMLLKLISYIISGGSSFNKQNKTSLKEISGILSQKYSKSKEAISLISKIIRLLDDNNESVEFEDNVETADKKMLKQALENLNDPLPPIKAQGLYELRELLLKESPVVDYGVVLELHLNEMKNEEPFVYLNSIRGLVILCNHEKSLEYVMRLYDEYGKKDSILNISFEEELRLGEVLSQAFQNKKYLLNKDAQLHKMFNIVIEKINANNAKTTDNRVRMSAMSILGILLQVNMDVLTESELVDCFSCIKGILTFEFDEKDDSFKILRRASIYLLNDMIYNSGLDRFVISFEEYESLVALLKYNRDVKETDDVTIDMIDKLLSIIQEIWNQTFTLEEDTTDSLLNTLKIR